MKALHLQDPYLRYVELVRSAIPSYREYPFHLGAIRKLDRLEFHPKATYIVGENGMGKSTLMESIAVVWGFNPEGGTKNFSFSTRATHSRLHEYQASTRDAEAEGRPGKKVAPGQLEFVL